MFFNIFTFASLRYSKISWKVPVTEISSEILKNFLKIFPIKLYGNFDNIFSLSFNQNFDKI